jgi:hypothetical protein
VEEVATAAALHGIKKRALDPLRIFAHSPL